MTEVWRSCGSCKKPIGFNTRYYACDISTCRQSVYCSMDCFSMHVPIFRHKDAWAEERHSPKEASVTEPVSRTESARLVTPTKSSSGEIPKDVLVVVSKLKAYIDARSGMNTSASVMDRLSEMIRFHCDKAIENARREGRKTVMDRDFSL